MSTTESPGQEESNQTLQERPLSSRDSSRSANTENLNTIRRQSLSVDPHLSVQTNKIVSEEIVDLDTFLRKRQNNYTERKKTLKVFLKRLDIERFDDFMKKEDSKCKIMDKRTTLDQVKKSVKDTENKLSQREKALPMYINELWSQKHYSKVLKLASFQFSNTSVMMRELRHSSARHIDGKKDILAKSLGKETSFLPLISGLSQDPSSHVELGKESSVVLIKEEDSSQRESLLAPLDRNDHETLALRSPKKSLLLSKSIEMTVISESLAEHQADRMEERIQEKDRKEKMSPLLKKHSSLSSVKTFDKPNRASPSPRKFKGNSISYQKSFKGLFKTKNSSTLDSSGLNTTNNQGNSTGDTLSPTKSQSLGPTLRNSIFKRTLNKQKFLAEENYAQEMSKTETLKDQQQLERLRMAHDVRSIISDCTDLHEENKKFIKDYQRGQTPMYLNKIKENNTEEAIRVLDAKRTMQSKEVRKFQRHKNLRNK